MQGTRRPLRPPFPALLGILLSGTAAFGQAAPSDAPGGALALRGTGSTTAVALPPPSDPVAAPGPAVAKPRPGGRAPKPATRRTGRATAALQGNPAYAIRPTLTAPGTVADVQPQLNGVPDPILVGGPAGPGGRPPLRRTTEDDPYAPLGIRAGGLMLYPVLGEAIGYETNPNRTVVGRGSFVSQTEGELAIRSDWTRHEVTGYLRGAWNEYPSEPAASRPEGAGRINARIDVERDTAVTLEGRYLIDTQRGDSANLLTAVRTRPVVYNEGATIGVSHRFNRLIASVQATFDRADFEDAISASGIRIDQSDRAVSQYGAKGRLGYELKPGLVPFVELLGDTRIYDRRVDNGGFARSSDGFGGRIGTTFEITRLVSGEIGAGAINRSYEDPRLGNLTSPLVDASVLWAVSPLTTVRATASATVDETTYVGANGVRTLRGALEVAHALRRNLIVTAGLSAVDFQYAGIGLNEHGFGASLRADWKLNRLVGLRASYAYERLDSQIAGASYATNIFLVGMRLTP